SNSLIEYVSLKDLAPLAMDKIEALSIEGLRIQCGMTDEDAPSNISDQCVGRLSASKGKNAAATDVVRGGSLGLDDGTCGLQLMDVKRNDDGQDGVDDGLMSLSLTLEEWMKLDSGEIDLADEQTSKVLAAHHATSLDQFRGRSKKRRGRKCGLLGNNFTVALMVQLHNPLRNYESVGAPMLALIQVERVFVPPKPKIHSTVSMAETHGSSSSSSSSSETVEEEEEAIIPRYKISEVHVAGLNVAAAKDGKKEKQLWGGSKNRQLSSRWLLANGMGKKTNKHPLLKSKPDDDDTLWSISSGGRGLKNSHIRKPNIF
ncbi:hypothetical protein M569_17546, partial [Genlisea aurea]